MASRINTTGSVGTLPAVTNLTTSAKYFDNGSASTNDGTPLDASWFNMVQEELCAAAQANGSALSTSNNSQIADCLQEGNSLRSKESTSSIAGLNPHSINGAYCTHASLASLSQTCSGGHAVGIASSSSTASGNQAVTIGDAGSTASGMRSAAIGSNTCVASGTMAVALMAMTSTVSGNGSLCAVTTSSTASGTGTAVIGGSSNSATATAAAVIGSSNSDATGTRSFVAAAVYGQATGSSSVVLGSGTGSSSAAIAAASRSAVIATDNGKVASAGAQSLLVSSTKCELASSYSLALGYTGGSAPTYNGTNQNLTFRVNGPTGDVYADGTVGAGNADFAEYFPTADGAIPVGRLVTGVGKAVKAAGSGDAIRGVVSACPIVIGNAAPLGWAGKYQRDEFGAPMMATTVTEEGIEVTAPIPAAGYDASQVYVPRAARPAEWCPVALTGQVMVAVAADVAVGSMLGGSPGGLGVVATKPKGRPVEVLELVSPFDAGRGYGIALCLVG